MRRKQEPKPNVIQDTEEPLEVLASSVLKVAEGFKLLQRSRLTDRAAVILIQDEIGQRHISRDQIEKVLSVVPRLAEIYLKKEGKL